MTGFKGTPGPWKTNGLIIECDSGIHTIGEVSTWLPEYEDERKANARLIAAAPELLEALTELVEIIDGAVADDRSAALKLQIDSFTCQPARAAIAKALGEGQ